MAAVGVEGREVVDMLSSCLETRDEENDSKINLAPSVEFDNFWSREGTRECLRFESENPFLVDIGIFLCRLFVTEEDSPFCKLE